MNNPDQPHDPTQAATGALLKLGHQPGADPVQQLHQLAADLTTRRTQAHRLLALMQPGTTQHTRQILTVSDLFDQCTTALIPLAEAQLDGMEQRALADAFGLDRPGGAA